MKVLILSVVSTLVLFSAAPSRAATNDELLAQAQAAYALRGYDVQGVQKAQAAAGLYAQLIAQTTDDRQKAVELCAQSEALFFVGTASDVREIKLANHLNGIGASNQAAQLMGISDVTKVTDTDVANLRAALSPADLALVGDALYFRGINLNQWSLASSALDSLNKWPELRDNMNLIVNLGLKDIHEYGAYRTLGRGYAKIPTVLGGDIKKAEKYLQMAVLGTLVPGQSYSTNGRNNTFYAEVLKADQQVPAAKALLQSFIAADPAVINPLAIPETTRSQAEARLLLSKM